MILAGLYSVYSNTAAVKAVQQCRGGESAAAYWLPGLLLILLCGVSILIVMRAIGPEINEIFQQLQQLQQLQ